MRIRIATRGSALALKQAAHVSEALRSAHAGLEIELVVVKSEGDREADKAITRIGITGVFTRDVDRAVLERRADLAVHSLKDLPTAHSAGLRIAAIPAREDPRDAFVAAPGTARTLAELPAGAVVATGSSRRRALVLDRRSDLRVVDLRGNVDSRLDRIAAGAIDGAILACAGLRRLGRTDAIGEILDPPRWLPAPGQGALAVVVRDDDEQTLQLAEPLDHHDTHVAVMAERALLQHLDGGCQLPIGSLAHLRERRLALDAFVATSDGRENRRGFIEGPVERAAALGAELADAMLHDGADRILADARAPHAERPA